MKTKIGLLFGRFSGAENDVKNRYYDVKPRLRLSIPLYCYFGKNSSFLPETCDILTTKDTKVLHKGHKEYKKKSKVSATTEPFGDSTDVLLIWEELKLFMIYHLNNYSGFVFLRDTFCALCGELLTTKDTKSLHKGHKQYKKKRTSRTTIEPFGGSADVLLIWEELKLFIIYHLNNYLGFVFLRDTFCALCGDILSTKDTRLCTKVTKAFPEYPNDSIFLFCSYSFYSSINTATL